MSDPRSKISSKSKDDTKLLEVVSEDLCSRLQIEEGFVWVDMPAGRLIGNTPESTNATDLETVNTFQLCSESDIKAAQLFSDDEKDDVTISDEDSVDADFWDQFQYKRNPNNYAKGKCTSTKWVQWLEHGTAKISSREKNTCERNRNSLLPDVKFPPSTIAILEKLITDRYMGIYNDVVGTGRKSVVLHAECNRYVCKSMLLFNAVKVYKISDNVEKNEIIFERVKREYEHLKILSNNCKHKGVPLNSPAPTTARANVIVMGFVGHERTAPSIKDAPSEKDNASYTEIVEFMERCYNRMRLVHGKLSAKNILYWFGNPVFIGWSHSVKTDHPMAMRKLMKDCKFITEFFKKRGLKVKCTEELFRQITGVSKISNKLKEIVYKNLYEKYDCNPNRKIVDAKLKI